MLEKALEKQILSDQTKTFIIPRGSSGVEIGWYASVDGKTVRERKGGVEGGLERAWKDGERKKMQDPLVDVKGFLERRKQVLEGTMPERDPRTRGGDGYIVEKKTLIDYRQRRPSANTHSSTQPSTSSQTIARSFGASASLSASSEEAHSRQTSERARAQALIASRRRAATSTSSSIGSSTPRTELGAEGEGAMYNRLETREAEERRRGGASWGGHGYGNVNSQQRVREWGRRQ